MMRIVAVILRLSDFTFKGLPVKRLMAGWFLFDRNRAKLHGYLHQLGGPISNSFIERPFVDATDIPSKFTLTKKNYHLLSST
jgi:hypothetical protein